VVSVPRPVLGQLRLSTGDVVTLDRGVLMGRRPVEGRQAKERPHLVQLDSPDQGISRNHVEVRLDGWHVLVVDLNSTNGTLITRPGQQPERLRPEQPTMIEPGTVVTLADDITFVYEATV
jgi:pSer/pThr/pTyr-binding forkhead associated (FHA) protein